MILPTKKELLRLSALVDVEIDHDVAVSALENAFIKVNGADMYPSVADKTARLCFSLIRDCRSKRLGVLVLLTYLRLNDIELRVRDIALINIADGLYSGTLSYSAFSSFIKDHIVK